MTAAAIAGADASAWRGLLDALPDAAWLATLPDRRVVAANAAAAALLGRPASALVGADAVDLAGSPEDLAWWDASADGEPSPLHSESVLRGAGGRLLAVDRSLRGVVLGDAGAGAAPTHVLAVVRDRAAAVAIDAERERRIAELQSTLEATRDGLLVTDADGRVRAVNRRFVEIWALPPSLLAQRDDGALRDWMRGAAVDGPALEQRHHAVRAQPSAARVDRIELRSGRVVERTAQPLLIAGIARGRVESFREVGDRAAAERPGADGNAAGDDRDPLTGLADRTRLAARTAAAAAEARRTGSGYALLVIDLDRFRRVNELLGPDAGDRALIETAARISGCLRQHDLLARLGGDQFALLLGDADCPAAEAAARRVMAVVAEPWLADGTPFTLTCSIGIALAPSHGSTIDELSRHADAAMRAVKAAGRANFRLHPARAEVDRRDRARLDPAMRQALVSNRFRLHYQPQVELAGGRIVGAEALLRWRDPELGEMPPARFVAAAEDSGLIVALGDWVLTQAVRQAAQWQQRGHALPVAINVSTLQFRQPGFVERVAAVLGAARLPPSRLEIELTEDALADDPDESQRRLAALATLGVRLAIDDFGSGPTTIARLRRLPVGTLKIDPSFVAGLPDDAADAGIVGSIVQLARSLRMTVVAEGVETDAQRQALIAAGCERGQGWLYAPALDTLSLEQRLADDGGDASGAGPGTSAAPRIRLVSG